MEVIIICSSGFLDFILANEKYVDDKMGNVRRNQMCRALKFYPEMIVGGGGR
jgi:hypothetical protein